MAVQVAGQLARVSGYVDIKSKWVSHLNIVACSVIYCRRPYQVVTFLANTNIKHINCRAGLDKN